MARAIDDENPQEVRKKRKGKGYRHPKGTLGYYLPPTVKVTAIQSIKHFSHEAFVWL